jgi:ABC-type transport system substrate-binding protein
VRNEHSNTPRTGNVARVEYVHVAADDAQRSFEQGELDLIRVMYTPQTADHVHTGSAEGALTWLAYLGFDHSHSVVGDVEFRRALAHAVEREALARLAPVNLVVAGGGVVPPALHGHTPDIAPRFDPDLARDHLERSRTGAGAKIALGAEDVWESFASALAASWRDVLGIDVELDLWPGVESVSGGGRSQAGAAPLARAPIAILGWLPGYPDPEYMLRLLLHSDALTNAGRFADPSFDELIERARRAGTSRERLELFHDADRYVVADAVGMIPLVYGRSMAFVQPWVHGWWEFAKSSASYADVVVER